MVSRWSGFPTRSTIQNIVSELDKFFNNLYSDDFKILPKFLSPKVNVYKKAGKYFLDFFVPYAKKEDIDIQIENDILTVHVKTRRDETIKDDDFIIREVSRGQATRAIVLGEDVDQESIKASLKDGILTITFNSKVKAKQTSKKIEIKE